METVEIAREVRVEKRLLHAHALARYYREARAAGNGEVAARIRRRIDALAGAADLGARTALEHAMTPPD